ncbi:MAG TPA: P1 family peptidase, partial [Beijerinckiaceae bacterium]
EFGGRGWPARIDPAARAPRLKGDPQPAPREATTIAIVATDAPLTKGEAKHMAVMAHDGLARAIRPAHAPMDGDLVFAASTARAGRAPDLRARADLGQAAVDCLARAVARGVYEATALPFAGALPAWRDLFGGR